MFDSILNADSFGMEAAEGTTDEEVRQCAR
jgi:hypothetical protein